MKVTAKLAFPNLRVLPRCYDNPVAFSSNRSLLPRTSRRCLSSQLRTCSEVPNFLSDSPSDRASKSLWGQQPSVQHLLRSPSQADLGVTQSKTSVTSIPHAVSKGAKTSSNGTLKKSWTTLSLSSPATQDQSSLGSKSLTKRTSTDFQANSSSQAAPPSNRTSETLSILAPAAA